MGVPITVIFIFSLFLLKVFFRRELIEDQLIEKQSSIQELMKRDEEAMIIKNKDTLKKAVNLYWSVLSFYYLFKRFNPYRSIYSRYCR